MEAIQGVMEGYGHPEVLCLSSEDTLEVVNFNIYIYILFIYIGYFVSTRTHLKNISFGIQPFKYDLKFLGDIIV